MILQEKHIECIEHLFVSYATWWNLPAPQISIENNYWQIKSDYKLIEMPCKPEQIIPESICKICVVVNKESVELPYPGEVATLFSADLLSFLAGQLWRAEELEKRHLESASRANHVGYLGDVYGFFDKPIVDLWMRFLFDELYENAKIPPAKFWMTYDVDCLRKWKRLGVMKHLVKMPLLFVQGQFNSWFKLTVQALKSHFPHLDPWYTIPQMLTSLENAKVKATFFWLGHEYDHKAHRYDVMRPEYKKQVLQAHLEGHKIGLHGSPLHAHLYEKLNEEKNKLEAILVNAKVKVHRQHYLKIVPSDTFCYLEKMQIAIDSTMGFNDRTGYRCGSTIPIRWWCFKESRVLKLYEVPFALGDWTLHSPSDFDAAKSMHEIQKYIRMAQWTGGMLTVDFHELYFSKDYEGHAEFHDHVLTELKSHLESWNPEEILQ